MCFSPTASFLTAGVTGVIGLAAMSRVSTGRELLLAGTPLLFAVQQTIEGLLWLKLPLDATDQSAANLTLTFLLLAQVVWPVYAPAAVLLIERDHRRRRLMAACLLGGAAISAYLFAELTSHRPTAQLVHGHIVCFTGQTHPLTVAAAYLACVSMPLLASSRRSVMLLGMIVLLGCSAAYAFYWRAFQSVWCYFAAAGSVVLLSYFHVSKNVRRSLAPGQA